MNISLLGQGYEPISNNSVGKNLIKFLADASYHSFTAISAFSSQAGVKGLSKHIAAAKHLVDRITIVTGIDQRGTSKEALEALLHLNVNTFVFYQSSITIFHPKVYLFEGKEKSELIIGSSNLTSQGLFTNVEASILISIDNLIEADRKIVEQLKSYFKAIFDFTNFKDANLKNLSKEMIAELVKAKVVATEAERRAAHDKLEPAEGEETENIISKIFPKREIAKIPPEFSGRHIAKPNNEPFVITSTPSKKVWEGGPLTETDLNIHKRPGTNIKGEMLLKKGKSKEFDQKNYFRNEVFKNLKWSYGPNEKTSKPNLESATAKFKIIVEGKICGDFELTIVHAPRKNTTISKQKSSTTALKWGDAKKCIAKEDLIGKSAILYENNKEGEFTLEIM